MYKILVILGCFLALSQNVYAHPPSSIDLAYNKNSQVFTLTINHLIAGKGHFIKQITININGEKIQSKTYPFQNNKRIVNFSFPKPEYEKDNMLSVEVTCNRTGPVTKDFSIDKVIE